MGAGKRLARNVHVTDDNGEQHVFGPDDEVPGWAAKAITNPAAWGEEADDAASAPAEEENASAYDSLKRADLEDEVARRNEGREEADHITVGGTGTKADLVAALEADDEALAG